MSKETDYIKLCKSLRKDSPCILCQTDNKYVCAHTLVKRYVNNDLDKLKKLKAESMAIGLHDQDYEHSISLCTLIFSVFVLFKDIITMNFFEQCFLYILFIAVLLAFLHVMIKRAIIEPKLKYHSYIDLAIIYVENELTATSASNNSYV